MTCPHGFLDHAECWECYRPERDGRDSEFWGTCYHGVSLAPTAHCSKCDVREDDFDA